MRFGGENMFKVGDKVRAVAPTAKKKHIGIPITVSSYLVSAQAAARRWR